MKYMILMIVGVLCLLQSHAQQLYQMQEGAQSRVSSFENSNGVKGSGGKTNKTAKGNAFQWLYPRQSVELLNIKEQGVIQRIWLTINQSPRLLRSLRLQMYWDGNSKAAVDVPLGDFFVSNLGRTTPFQSALFASPEGRSFNCYIPMPFKKGARITLTNESAQDTAKLFYDVDFVLTKTLPPDALYFHACWRRQMTSKLGEDVVVLPKLNGKGRFLGMSVGLNTDSAYDKTWWGEGEVKMYLDGDTSYPTINGTGAEDYIGTGWGMGAFNNWYQGAPVADEPNRQFVFYRWHLPDAIWFQKDIKVTLQQIGGAPKEVVQEKLNKGINLQPVTVDNINGFVRLLDMPTPPSINDKNFPDGWVNFYRVDDFSAVSYFYLDKPISNLPPLDALDIRLKNVK
jgi:hypothetical protein